MPPYQPGADTRNRLMEAAAEVFAEHGFHHARVSDICRIAQANIAAVNYHFGDKEQLYVAVIQRLHEEEMMDAPYLRVDGGLSADERLHAFIKEFLADLLRSCPSARLGKLMAREMIDPTKALDFIVENVVRPINQFLRGIVADILEIASTDERVGLCAASILSQCMVYFTSKEIALRMDPKIINDDHTYDSATIEQLAEHITRFSLRGMQGLTGSETLGSMIPSGR